jgi:aspartate oxidase
MENLLAAVASNSNIDLRCNTTAIDLIKSKQPSSTKNLLNGSERCDGAFVLSNGCVELIEASNVILATGGCGDLYSNTSNPQSARGDGVAMALRAGAKVVSRYNIYLVVWIKIVLTKRYMSTISEKHGVPPVPPHDPLYAWRTKLSSD